MHNTIHNYVTPFVGDRIISLDIFFVATYVVSEVERVINYSTQVKVVHSMKFYLSTNKVTGLKIYSSKSKK